MEKTTEQLLEEMNGVMKRALKILDEVVEARIELVKALQAFTVDFSDVRYGMRKIEQRERQVKDII